MRRAASKVHLKRVAKVTEAADSRRGRLSEGTGAVECPHMGAQRGDRTGKLVRYVPLALFFIIALAYQLAFGAELADIERLQNLVAAGNVDAVRAMGRAVLPALAGLYEGSDEALRTSVARTFYQLGWKSPEAKRVLMKDAHTPNAALRLEVQWALGRVSNDLDVVDVLVANMRDDANPIFRDKAACALAYDQIHLTDRQKVRLFAALIDSLGDAKFDVRSIALQALSIHTGQTKGFDPGAPAAERGQRIQAWRQWLEEYKSGL